VADWSKTRFSVVKSKSLSIFLEERRFVRTSKQMASFLKEEANSNLQRHRRLHPSYKEKERKKESNWI
jgi:hypothetical protein